MKCLVNLGQFLGLLAWPPKCLRHLHEPPHGPWYSPMVVNPWVVAAKEMELSGFAVEFWCWSYIADMLSKEDVAFMKWCDSGKKEKKMDNYKDM
ncbi:hypothetical protein H5410_027735 [Solanum commersonii]|uniref:Uncharacterized protein n=1 Tax=Solanum commersonii TaxID=4109 RepID=A0A9J5Z000_SOLCO|nr:hypothetical protein H5410_027735 [Solanum commersonii]